MSDPELHEISSIAPKWDPHRVNSRRAFILVSERLAEREHENGGLQHHLGDVDLPNDSCVILADLPACTHRSRLGACRSWGQVSKSVRSAERIHNTTGEPFGAD